MLRFAPMGDAARKLYDVALALTPDERAALIEALSTVDSDPGWAEAWGSEIERRVALDPEGESSRPWPDALAELRAGLPAKSP